MSFGKSHYVRGSRANQKRSEHDRLVSQLILMREEAQVSQRELARQLGWHNASVIRMERGERSIEVVEFIDICRLLGKDPQVVLGAIARA